MDEHDGYDWRFDGERVTFCSGYTPTLDELELVMMVIREQVQKQ